MNLVLISVTLMVVVVGALLAFQAPANAALARGIGDPVWAAAFSFGIGFLLLSAIAIGRGGSPSLASLQAMPWWALMGGLMGAIWVLAAIWSVPRLGVVTMMSAMVLGQLIAAIIIDGGGIMGLETREISSSRIIAIVLVGLGVIVSYR
ncbi:transporter family-2 protein [Cognatiyoonia koreensis]|uniref:Transporter family-2 protein n=1 Tax=Cognatiyoonia koreensis TaxID=364200 RepID=A0A1I0QQ15_9RHOB|nr:DMT family transporter [Cognatiyoonia koreensis]SEW29570.1 transporter family-2 protein [Cognatiyoonia koreensis]